MRKNIRNILYGSLLLAGILLVALVLNHFFGAVVAGIYAVLSIIGFVWTLHEIHIAPLKEEEPTVDNK